MELLADFCQRGGVQEWYGKDEADWYEDENRSKT